MHQNYFRDYRPEQGRYLESDPIGLIAGVNLYGYVEANPFKYFDNFGHIKWKGAYQLISAGASKFGAGAGGFIASFTLRSECVNGRRGWAWVGARGLTIGFGIGVLPIISESASTIEMEDFQGNVNPFVFNGGFSMLSITILLFYSPLAEVKLGGAIGQARGWGLSTDLASVGGFSGISYVIRQRVECCND